MVESCGKFIVIRKRGEGVGGEEKKESHEFSSKLFSRFIFLLQFSWEKSLYVVVHLF